MADVILVLNAGSSSIKFSLFLVASDSLEFRFRGQIEGLYTAPRFAAKDAAGATIGAQTWAEGTRLGHDGAIDHLIGFLSQYRKDYRLIAVGHRVVHGGLEFSEPALVTAPMLASLEKFVPLAPLHQPHNLTPIRVVTERRPELPQVACFDTAFHRAQPELAQVFALPAAITERGVRRYGFHGLSYEYIAGVLPQLDAESAAGRVVAAHLGNGASMCAMKAGRSVATTMGFTAVEGLPMGTRCGAIDPGVMLYLMDELKMMRGRSKPSSTSSPACSVFRVCPATCGHCSPATIRGRDSLLNFSRTGSGANSVRWRQRLAGWTQSCSPEASANTHPSSANWCVGMRHGSGWISMLLPMPRTDRASARLRAAFRYG
jgi:acetate kinase